MSDQKIFDEITRLDTQRTDATLAKDVGTVANIIGSTLRYIHGSGTDETRELYLERLTSGHYDYKKQEVTKREFRRFGDTVLVHGDMHIQVTVQGNDKDFMTRYLQVWALEGGDWKFVAWESTPLPA